METEMETVVVRYRTKPGRAEENQALIEDVFAALHADAPEGLRYTALRLDDGVSFVHVATIDTADGANPLTATPAFGAFVRDIGDRCEEAPVAIVAKVVGSYR